MNNRTGKIVRDFYNKTPFPNYELNRFKCKEDLILAMGKFAHILDRSIPKDATVIDVGTGTGQLSAFLSLKRKVVGIDFSDSSLRKARQLKKRLKLNNLTLKEIDILDRKQIEELGSFDYVLCLGVLHHTGNSYGGFENICKLLKPNGRIAIGLYNRFGRIPLKIRILLVKTFFKKSEKIKNYFIKMQINNLDDKERTEGWWNDQYFHPHESTHTVGEILQWFKKNSIEYIESVPSLNLFNQRNIEISGVWNNAWEKYPWKIIQFFKQLSWIWKTQKEGGYWITFGRLNL